MPEQVSPAITDAVTQVNTKVVGEAPAMALGTLLQSNSHATSILLHNAVQMQANQAASNQAATTVGIMQLYSTSPAAIAAAAQATNSSFTSQLAAVAQLMNALRHWRG
ncbi:RebB family R body protein [Burkholderia ubonensis]|uniref:RebB family R body protein n=1 Tax=Burkholderia ubonensis TaxID=101571 RepID=UPI000753B5D4|nr:RebB family R body protein [Burkholderia ubonensis]KVD00354.1 thioredoxin reductase [Burkholderia ubonensis]KVD64803.1 thioredoxin reductase [Burkholderia ubonensis]KVV58838.1 thioredoxin reductase [Burkholderia ubonensis]KVW17620.1 thioredoxin reductase [Burkholderia ubonensis]KWN69282.1 thioredoxin reductase [Burkholderia ubonensis]